MKLAISGGGIAGLTLGLLSKKTGQTPIILERRDELEKPSFGGGIGLWPPSQMVMQRLGLLDDLEKQSYYMPSACYYDSAGRILGQPSSNFSSKFPVMCLERATLTKLLYRKCIQQGVEVRTHSEISEVISSKQGVNIKLLSGEKIQAKMLIGTDGIGSKVRNIIQRQINLPEILPYHCGYAYFRAVVDIEGENTSDWHKHAFQSWGQKKRFGYVPLKAPKTFWFVAIPIGEEGLQKMLGSEVCSEQQKKWIAKQFESWKGPIDLKRLIQITPANLILRTDISKVKDVSSFPWYSKNKNIAILGDSANATAPNLAQGAGLAIQSAWDFISMVNIESLNGIQEYIQKRKKRAETVQFLADMVALIGQLPRPLSQIRNIIMRITASKYFRPLQSLIFEEVVSYSLGGKLSKLYWLPPYVSQSKLAKNIRNQNSLLGKIMGPQQFLKLPGKTQQFRASILGSGTGKVNVKSIPFSSLIGLPSNMENMPFGAYCETYFKQDGQQYQKWTRIFGEGESGAVKYSTFHRAIPNLQQSFSGFVLTESLGLGPDIFRFGYLPHLKDNKLKYESLGLWFNSLKLPIPNFFLPTSQWQQDQNINGWNFKGKIKMPKILGGFTIMDYSGIFQPKVISQQVRQNSKRVIIAGGTGMIGSVVAKKFYLAGWNVEILSRSEKNWHLPFAKIHQWNPTNSQDKQQVQRLSKIFQGVQMVINLSGSNPGEKKWTNEVKNKIVESRVSSIKLLSQSFAKMTDKKPYLLQASAAGIYGDRKDQILLDSSQPGQQNTFRINTCKEIETITKQLNIQNTILRIGHVFSSQGGLFPNLQLASKMRVKKFGNGQQFVPWVHIEDLANACLHIAEKFDYFRGKAVNISSPEHKNYIQIMQALAKTRERNFCFLRVPETVLKQVLGEVSSVIFDSQRMQPRLLKESGFNFEFCDLQKALTSKQCLQ